MILIIDNYDSFTYNLAQYVGELGYSVGVYRNDQISLTTLSQLKPKRIIISPGPGKPADAGITLNLIQEFSRCIPILGICLGHQSIGSAFGAKVIKTSQLMHGKTSLVFHSGNKIFKDIPSPFTATRYHSLIIDKKQFSSDLQIIAWTQDNIIMGICHKKYKDVIGIQFHPESLWTPVGKKLLKNFLD
uniref:anthranilate synthase component 2 n=1 Tax=Rhodospora sordida TaxID=362230 RepID=UPI001FCCC68E|nr:anthranilate synthase component 2 [Rhodospora sordida]UNJ14997.1 anthranilate synthase component 2 [Rhodospora sordida]